MSARLLHTLPDVRRTASVCANCAQPLLASGRSFTHTDGFYHCPTVVGCWALPVELAVVGEADAYDSGEATGYDQGYRDGYARGLELCEESA